MGSHGIMVVAAKDGKAHFSGVGTLKPSYLADKKIVMESGKVGIVRANGEISESTKLSDMYIDIDTENMSIGDFGVVYPEFTETDSAFYANGLSDVIALSALIKALPTLGDTDLTVVFSAQKILNGRGMRGFFADRTFDKVFTLACYEKTEKGCVVVVKDKSAVASSALRDEICGVAKECGIEIQLAVSDENFMLGNGLEMLPRLHPTRSFP